MKYYFFAFGAFILIALSACKQDGKSNGNPLDETNASTLSGYWVSVDFCSRAGKAGSILKTINGRNKPYAYALTFDGGNPDSVTCYNGFETWKMHVTYRKDTLEIKNAKGDRSIYLVYDPATNKDLTLFDGTSGSTQIDRFTLSKAKVKNGYSAFRTAINSSMMAGNFESTGKGAGPVRFGAEGNMTGYKDYDRYELCAGGDCFVLKDMDVISLRNSKKEDAEQMFGFRFSSKKDSLFLYNLINQNPEEKGAYVTGDIAQTFLRKNSK